MIKIWSCWLVSVARRREWLSCACFKLALYIFATKKPPAAELHEGPFVPDFFLIDTLEGSSFLVFSWWSELLIF